MKPTIYLPTRAIKKEDVETMLNLLKSAVPSDYGVGLEIMGKRDDFTLQENLETISKNILSVKDNLGISIHGFSGGDVYDGCNKGGGIADLRTENGKQLLNKYILLGMNTKADYVHVHGGAGYRGELSPFEKNSALKKIKENMESCKSSYSSINFPIGIEVLPTPSMGDADKTPETVWHDCVESIDDCLAIVKDTDMKVTFDTCHYAASIDKPINFVEALQKLGHYLGFVHISDTDGLWNPNKSTFREGLIPGEGKIGEAGFADFFKYLKQENPNIGICVEVYNKDFTNPVESEESIRRIVDWLKRE